MSATTMEANPYNAPDAELDQGGNETYEPSIFTFQGRIGRLRYIAYSFGVMFLLMFAMMIAASVLGVGAAVLGGMGGGMSETGMGIVGILMMLAFYVPIIVFSVMFGKRRLNDLNRSGWWFLLSIIPFVNILLSIYMMFFPGTAGNNNFGPAPSPNSLGVKILAWFLIIIPLLGIAAAIILPAMMGAAPQ